MRRPGVIFAAVLAASLMAGAAQARDRDHGRNRRPVGEVALTFDDLPGLTIFSDQPYVDYLNDSLLRGLKRHRLPATGFVNEGKLDEIVRSRQIGNLRKWLDAGMNLGNHTFSHDSPDELGARGYIADIERGEPVTRGLLGARGKRLQWFRHPYLETGFPEAAKVEINAWLAGHGYRIAPVTIDADDWEFAEPYDDAIARHDEVRRQRIRREYLDYTDRAIGWYQSGSQALFGRQIAFVMLLHATRLNADCIDDLAKILRRRGLKAVSLDLAMTDAAYRLGDPYVGHDGIEWLERWSNVLNKELPWDNWRDPPKQIAQEYERVNNDLQLRRKPGG